MLHIDVGMHIPKNTDIDRTWKKASYDVYIPDLKATYRVYVAFLLLLWCI